jgi:serine beta-lactamase-like protein LACTB, mitochondrial
MNESIRQRPKGRKQIWFALIAVAIGLPLAGLAGVLMYMNVTAKPVHPNPQDVKSVAASAPLPEWTGAVERARQSVRERLSKHNLPGLSVAVGVDHDGRQEIVWAEGFGFADIDKRTAVTPATRFRIGHVSKALTSAAVGLLVEQGRLRLDDEIQTYVPSFPRKEWPVTVRQLMGHVAGVRHYLGEEADVPSAHCDRASEGLQSFANDPLLFEPDTRSRYSTYGWVLVSAAVEAAAKDPFFTFMRTKIFAPLGMNATMPDSATEPIPDRATFYFPRFSGENQLGLEVAHTVDYSCFAGAGAFLSTPSDLVMFGIAMHTGKLLQPATVRTLQTPQVLVSGQETEFGLGWTLENVQLAGKPTRLASDASRSLLGGSTSFLIFPERRLVVAVTANTSYAFTREYALAIAEAFAEKRR